MGVKRTLTTTLIMLLLGQNLVSGEIEKLYKKYARRKISEQTIQTTYKDKISEEIIQSYVKQHKNERTIVIDKTAKKLYLFNNNKLEENFPVPLSLGFDPVEDKEVRGDGRTPEGEFFVYDKHPSKYFTWFLELNYPNTEDAKRGLKKKIITKSQAKAIDRGLKKRNGEIRYTGLGDAIGIHTSGGKVKYGSVTDSDWTLGCIALEYVDMQKLYGIAKIGDNILSIGKKYKSEFKEEKKLIKKIIDTKINIDKLLDENKIEKAEEKIEEIIKNYDKFNSEKITVDNYKLNKRISKIFYYKSQIDFPKSFENENYNIPNALDYAIKAYELEPECNPIKQNLAKQILWNNNPDSKYNLDFALELIDEALNSKIEKNKLEAKVIKSQILFKKGEKNKAFKILDNNTSKQYQLIINYLKNEMKNNTLSKDIYDTLRDNITL